ncbi:MAG: hypothetical protein ACRCVV_16575 [Shewanella sp.]
MLTLEVNTRPVEFLVDTGATYSTLNFELPKNLISDETTEVRGFSGAITRLPFSKELTVQCMKKQSLTHSFLLSYSSPTNLLGRDLLVKLGAEILCSPEGIIVTMKNGITMNCSIMTTMRTHGQWLLSANTSPQGADIYWGRVLLGDTGNTLNDLYSQWEPWILSLAPYTQLIDPLHVTLFYDRTQEYWYQEQFDNIAGEQWEFFWGRNNDRQRGSGSYSKTYP